MVNLRKRSDELMYKESRQEYLQEHPDRNVEIDWNEYEDCSR